MAVVNLHRPHAVRTEIEVAADAIMAVFETGIMGSGAERLVRVAEIAGIPVPELRAAWERNQRRGYRPPSMRAAAAKASPPQAAPPSTPQQHGLARANERRWAKKNPAPGLRKCACCDETKAVAEFDIKNQRTGQMKSWCRPCTKAYQRERYLKATEVGLISNIRLLIEAGSPFVATPCVACGVDLTVGEEVEACDVALRHTQCPNPTTTGAP